MIKQLAIAAALVVAPASVYAQDALTCATAKEVFSNAPFNGDTTSGGNSIARIGPLPLSGAKSLIYKFTARDVDAKISVTSPYNFGLFVVKNCQAITSPALTAITSTDASNTWDLAATSSEPFVNGQTYYIVVSGNPGTPNDNQEGAFTATVSDTLPVTLKNFSVE